MAGLRSAYTGTDPDKDRLPHAVLQGGTTLASAPLPFGSPPRSRSASISDAGKRNCVPAFSGVVTLALRLTLRTRMDLGAVCGDRDHGELPCELQNTMIGLVRQSRFTPTV